ncbi:unnamed protein product [Penicillium salamii]|uniref:Uncharacterized protein n=1 Tax=Penicillium salamii TaxID=1612424 RepID=A0A9W4I4R0_9EURO|nr:unnamed protein product [Penicillium salamii]
MTTEMKYIFLLLSVLVFYANTQFVHNSGIRVLIRDAIVSKTLPGSNNVLKTVFTGIARVDRELMILTSFFYPAADGQNATLLLHIVGFSGSFASAWALVTMEAWRSGNRWKIIAVPLPHCMEERKGVVALDCKEANECSPMVFGVMAQLKTFALWGPLYCGLHLATSITATTPTVQNIRIPRIIQLAIPIAYAIGYVIPSVLMVLPAPMVISTDQKQIFIAIWQAWAISVGIITTLAFYLLSPWIKDDLPSDHRGVYAFAFVTATVPHLISWTISLASVVAPALFHDQYVQALCPSKVFELPSPWDSVNFPVRDVSVGAHLFLRWDCLIGSTSILVWAVTLYVKACRVGGEPVNWGVLGVKIALLTILTGPIGSAVALMWERDNLICYGTRGVMGQEKGAKKTK